MDDAVISPNKKLWYSIFILHIFIRPRWGRGGGVGDSSGPQVPDGHQRLSIVGRFQRQLIVVIFLRTLEPNVPTTIPYSLFPIP